MKIKLIVILLGVLICLQPLIWWKIDMWISNEKIGEGLDWCCTLSALGFTIGLVILTAYNIEEKQKD